MKKFILLATIILAATAAQAQTYFNNARSDYDMYYDAKFGIQFSGNLATATQSANFATANIAGFTAGINIDYPVSYNISVVPALLFTQKGFSANTPSGNYTQRTQSVDLPVLAKFRSGRAVNFYLGPQISYLISNTSQFNQDFTPSARTIYQYTGSNVRVQGVAGVGFDVSKSVSINARYAFDVNSTAQNGNTISPIYRMQTWQFGFGISI